MDDWQPTDTAPKVGTIIRAKRIYGGAKIWEGETAWHTVHFPALPPHPIDGDIYAPAYDGTGWMYPTLPKRVPWPTHWRPA